MERRGTELSVYSVCAELRLAYNLYKDKLRGKKVQYNLDYWGERSRL
jgi:hypothetical protein